jgi:hypothetical protein
MGPHPVHGEQWSAHLRCYITSSSATNDKRKSYSNTSTSAGSVLDGGIPVAHLLAAEIEMKNDPRLPERKDVEDKEFPCRSCGEKFNSLAEAEQHEKDCRNRETSGAKPAEPK